MKRESAGKVPTTRGRRGNALIEVTLMAPWIFFLFVGVLDFGFYSYALISVENATRVAALVTSTGPGSAGSQKIACDAVFQELSTMPNITASQNSCNALPLIVTATKVPAASAADAALCAGGCKDASLVAVTYQTLPMVPIPGILDYNYKFTRTVQMRVKGD